MICLDMYTNCSWIYPRNRRYPESSSRFISCFDQLFKCELHLCTLPCLNQAFCSAPIIVFVGVSGTAIVSLEERRSILSHSLMMCKPVRIKRTLPTENAW